ncbi:MAG: hypothetical protein O2886_04225 [Actinomycetota bacterium]|nr:hypothetical protein [Actinomycetota bacterium]
MRVIGWSFDVSFLTVNFLALVLLIAGGVTLNRLDQRTLFPGLFVVLVVLLSPAVLRTASEPRHWMLATGFSLLSAVVLSWILRCSLAGRTLRVFEVALCALVLFGGLLTEASLTVGLVAWTLIALPSAYRHPERVMLLRNVASSFALTAVLLLAVFPQAIGLLSKGSANDPAAATSSLWRRPEFDPTKARTYLRLLGDLWQIGGDARVTFVLLWGSLLFLFGVQLGVVLVRLGRWRGWDWFDFRVVTHGFVVGLVGSVWAALYLLLFSFGFLPDHAAGWKYILPHGVLLLVGVWDGAQRCPWRLVGGGLMVAALAYQSMVLGMDRNAQEAVVERLADSDRLVVFGYELDLLQVMYPLATGEFVDVPEIYLAGWDEEFEPWMCGSPPGGEDLVVAARRPPWGLGVDGVFGDSANPPQSSPIGTLERLEVASIVSC